MILRSWQAVFIVMLTGLALALLWPRSPDLVELQMRAGSYDQAIRVMEQQMVLAPTNDALRRKLGKAYERVGRLAPALKLIEDVAHQRPLTPAERVRGRKLALQTGSPQRALAIAEAPGAETPDAAALTDLVDLALQANDLAAARRYQARLVALTPTDVAALARLRDFALAGADLTDAIQAQRALVARDTTPVTVRRLSDLQLQAGDPKAAYDALAFLPRDTNAAWQLQMARLAEWSKQPDRALDHWLKAYALAPNAELAQRLLGQLVQRPDDRAVATAHAVAARWPHDRVLRKSARNVLVAAGRSAEVLAELRQAVAEDPSDASAHTELVAYAEWKQHRDVAIHELSRWAARQGASPAGFEARARLAHMQAWGGQPAAARLAWYALLTDATGRVTPRVERGWRETLLAVSTTMDDLTPPGQHNLDRLSVLTPARLDVKRRAALAAYELGEPGAAIRAQRALLKAPGANRADALLLSRWLDWYGQPLDSFALLDRIDAEKPLSSVDLQEAAYRAGELENWDIAASFYDRAASRKPTDKAAWMRLAHTQEQRGDLPAAAAAWRHRIGLGEVTSFIRLKAVAVLVRLNREREALALVKAAGDRAETPVLRERVALSFALNDVKEQEASLRALVMAKPRDAEALVALGNLRDLAGDPKNALVFYERALAAAPDDPRVLTEVASRRLYAGDAVGAGPLVERLERVGPPSADAWRVVADYWADRDPAHAIRALDKLHALGPGDADSWLRRGELALAVGDRNTARRAWETALARTETPTARAMRGEAGYERDRARASIFENLGQPRLAEVAWLEARADAPTRVEPPVALARLRLADQDPRGAAVYVAAARKLAPLALEVRLVAAEWEAATGRHREAAEGYAALHRDLPALGFIVGAEARERTFLGAYAVARDVVRSALKGQMNDPDLREAYRGVREDGSSHIKPFAEYERSPVVNLTGGGATSAWRAGDAWRLTADTATRQWDDGASGVWRATEVGVGGRYKQPGIELSARGAVQRQDAGAVEPLGEVRGALEAGKFRVTAQAQQQRWVESAPAIARRGRETRVEAEVRWQPDPRVTGRLIGEASRLALDDVGIGAAWGATTELTLKPNGDSPWSVYWTFRNRFWGDAASQVGLPAEVRFHTLLVGYATRLGPVRFELQPGWSFDALAGQNAPTAAASIGLELGPDVEFELAGNVSGRAFNVGTGGDYQRLDAKVSWHF